MSIVRRKAFGLPLLNGLLQNTTQPRCTPVAASRYPGGRPCHPGYNTIRSVLRDHRNLSLMERMRNRRATVRATFQLCVNHISAPLNSTVEVITKKTGIPKAQALLLDQWTWDRYRTYAFPLDTAQMLGYQEVDGGDLSNMPSHLVESERRMAKEIAYDNQTRPGKPWASPKLRQIGRFPTEGLITAVCLMGEDRLVRGFAAFTERQNRSTVEEQALCFREFYQKATFASWWFEVAAHMGSREAALYLTRLCTHPYLRNFWRESQIAGPTLDLPRGMIQNEVTTNAETCSWPDFSTYMDLFYSADDLQKASNRGDAHYFLLGIANMRYRIKHNLFEHLDTKLHQPRIHPPHKHLLRIINHCLQKRSPVLEGYPKERLQEIRQTMLQELAEKFDDFEANFILAIEQGDWNSQDFKRYLSRSISPKSKLEHHGEHFYPFHHHAIWLSTLQQLQEVGVLAEKAASTSLVANVHSVASSTESDEDSEPPAFLPLDSRLSEALIYEAEVSEEKSETFFYDRALAATAIIQTISVFPGQAALYLNELIDSVKSNYLLEKKPRLRSQVKKLEEILQKDFGTSGYESMTGWQDKKIDEILQKSANPWDIIRSLQRQIVK